MANICVILETISNEITVERWELYNHSVLQSAQYLKSKGDGTLSVLMFGSGRTPDSLSQFPIDNIYKLDPSLPQNIETFDLAHLIIEFLKTKAFDIILTPSDTTHFPILSALISKSLKYPLNVCVNSVELFNNGEIYSVRPSSDGTLAQVFSIPVVLAIASYPSQYFPQKPPQKHILPNEPEVILSSSLGIDNLLIFARADVAPHPSKLKLPSPLSIDSCEEAISWLFDE